MPHTKSDHLRKVRDADFSLRTAADEADYSSKAWELADAISSLMTSIPGDEFVDLVRQGHVPKANITTFGSLISLAAQNKRADLIEPLIAAGCSVSARDFQDCTVLEIVIAQLDDPDLVAPALVLIEHGAGINESTAIIRYAAACGKAHLVEALIERGDNPNQHCPFAGINPLRAALDALEYYDCTATIKLLLERGASCDSNNNPSESEPESQHQRAQRALELLCEKPKSGSSSAEIAAAIDVLIAAGADLHPTDESPNPLGTAICAANDPVAMALLERGSDPRLATFAAGETAFQCAAQLGMARTVCHLLAKHGEDPGQTLPDGRLLLDATTHPEIRATLLSAAAQNTITGALANPASREEQSCPTRSRRALSL
jgi:hypothetical protein